MENEASMKKNTFFLFLLIFSDSSFAMEQPNNDEQWQIERTITHTESIKKALLIAGNKKLLIHGYGTHSVIKNVDTDKRIIFPHKHVIWSPVIDRSQRFIVTVPHTEEIALSTLDGKKISTITSDIGDACQVRKFSPSGDQFLIAGYNKVEIRDLEGKIFATCKQEEASVSTVKFFPNNNQLIFIAHRDRYQAKLWDLRSNKPTILKGIDPLRQASIHTEGNSIAALRSGDNGVVYLYDLRNRKHIYLSNFNAPKAAKFNRAGTHIITTHYDGNPLLWQTNTLFTLNDSQTLNYNTRLDHFYAVHGKFSPNGNHVMTHVSLKPYEHQTYDIVIWDLDGTKKTVLENDKRIYSTQFNESGDYICAHHEKNSVTLWKHGKN